MNFNARTRSALLIIVLIILVASAVSADVPRLISYQGRLTDDTGTPITDTLDITFRLYDDSAGSGQIWREDHGNVPVVEGLFTVLLGGTEDILPYFEGKPVFLTTEVTGIESSPRIQIVTVPHAWRAVHADTARFAESVVGEDYLPTSGGTLTGDLLFDSGDNGTTEAWMDLGATFANLKLHQDGVPTSTIFGQQYGGAAFALGSGSHRVFIDAFTAGGKIELIPETGSAGTITLDAGVTGNSAAQLPDDAISAEECLNEPGIAVTSEGLTLYLGSGMLDIATVTITTPTAGYVVVEGTCHGMTLGSEFTNYGIIQIDQAQGGGEISPYGVSFGSAVNTAAATKAFPVHAARVFQKSAGTHTFRLEGMAYNGNYADAITVASDPTLIATFYPSSYGTVSAYVSLEEAGQFDDVITETVTRTNAGGTETTATYHRVDLRELEIKALHARLEAEKAERELQEARQREVRRDR